jgi:two-component system chemotaxis sensor kinase CheA
MARPASPRRAEERIENRMSEMDTIVREFLVESRDNLDQFERGLVELERNPTARETLANVFRSIHSIKGATGFLGLSKLGAVSHAGESLLSRLRDGQLVIGAEIASALLALVDCIRQMLSNVEKTGTDGDADCTALIERLGELQAREATGAPAVPSNGPPAPAEAPAPHTDSSEAAHAGGHIRMDVVHLDKLMNLVGELVLARNELLQHSFVHQNPILLSSSQRLDAITTQLQDGIMKTRLQPIDNVWNKFPRVVRDAALQCGKTVRLEMEGKDTELDKTLIEAIKDPLTHLLRNSVDHGLETPAERVGAGKPAEGCLSLRAFHAEGQVNIEVSDDGAGIDASAIARSALERGLITPEQAHAMSEQDVTNMIFLRGLSTAKKVTHISGRGVGMDVVKTNIEKIGGKVTVHSQLGLGTTFKIRIPLTLAIMPALVVTTGGDRYAIPQANVVELVRLEGDEVGRGIQLIRDVAVYRLRGDLVPLIRLDEELGTAAPSAGRAAPNRMDVASIVILRADDHKFGLLVDDINDTQDIVVKPLGRRLGVISTFAGATIMGNGRVALILDVPGLAMHANVLSDLRNATSAAAALPSHEASDEKQALLLFVGDDDVRMAVPLSAVTRLEEFHRFSLERTGDQVVVQYLGEVLPLVNISDLLPERRRRRRHSPPTLDPDQTVKTIIYSRDGNRVGLVVNHVVDTIEQSLATFRPASRRGVVASVVIQGRITEILDLETIAAGVITNAAPRPAFQEARA